MEHDFEVLPRAHGHGVILLCSRHVDANRVYWGGALLATSSSAPGQEQTERGHKHKSVHLSTETQPQSFG